LDKEVEKKWLSLRSNFIKFDKDGSGELDLHVSQFDLILILTLILTHILILILNSQEMGLCLKSYFQNSEGKCRPAVAIEREVVAIMGTYDKNGSGGLDVSVLLSVGLWLGC